MAWRFVLYRLHGLGEWDGNLRKAMAVLKGATSSESMQRHLATVRKVAEASRADTTESLNQLISQDQLSAQAALAPLFLQSTQAALDRVQRLHDRLKARGVLRDT
jgi:hypothetical protein